MAEIGEIRTDAVHFGAGSGGLAFRSTRSRRQTRHSQRQNGLAPVARGDTQQALVAPIEFLDPDPDQVAAHIMPFAHGVQRLAGEALFHHLALLGGAVSAMSLGQGISLAGNPGRGEISEPHTTEHDL